MTTNSAKEISQGYRSQGTPDVPDVTKVLLMRTGLCGMGVEAQQYLFLCPNTVDNVLEELEEHFEALGCKVLKHADVKVGPDGISMTVDVLMARKARASIPVSMYGVTFRPYTNEEKTVVKSRNPGRDSEIDAISHKLECALWSAGVPYSIYKTL